MRASWSTPTTTSAGWSTGLKKLNLLDDTLIYYIIGDNGASAEGTLNGTFNEMLNFNGMAALETPEFLTARIDKFGGPESYNHYAVGWAHAMDTPYQWTKQVASHWGGTRNGTIVHWPKGSGQGRNPLAIPPRHRRRPDDPRGGGASRAGLGKRRAAEADRGRQHAVLLQRRQGRRAARDPVFRDVRQSRHLPQGLDRGDEAQDAVASHRRENPAFDDDVWELYDTSKDWSQANDLAKQMPEKLHELQRLWLIEAVRYNVLPLDDDLAKRMNPDTAGRPVLIKGNTPNPVRRHGAAVGELRHQHQEQVPFGHRRDRRARTGAEGVIIAQGAQHRRLEPVREGRQAEVLLQPGGVQHFYVEAESRCPRASIRCAWSSLTRAAVSARAAR